MGVATLLLQYQGPSEWIDKRRKRRVNKVKKKRQINNHR